MRTAFLVFTILLITAVPNWAAVIRLIEDAPGKYRIVGEGLSDVGALDLTITYDASTLQLSSVTQGPLLQGMMFAGNPNQPGRVRIGGIGSQSISGSGTLANLGGTIKDSSAVILGLTAKLTDASGNSLTVRTEYPKSTPLQSLVQPQSAPVEDTVDGSLPLPASRTASSLLSSTVTLPEPWFEDEIEPLSPVGEPEAQVYLPDFDEEQTAKEYSEPESNTELYIEKQKIEFPSVLDRFKEYEGPRTLDAMAALFDRSESDIKQSPAILLADGETLLGIDFPGQIGVEPSTVLAGVKLLSLEPIDENRSLARCIPQKDVLSAKILILGSEEIIEIPLVVAPEVSVGNVLVGGGQTLPMMDLDGDKEHTWKDDYILIANVLEKIQKSEGEVLPAEQGEADKRLRSSERE